MADNLSNEIYRVDCQGRQLLHSAAEFANFARQVELSFSDHLNTHRALDRNTLKRVHGTLAIICILRKCYAEAANHIARARELSDRPALKLTLNIIAQSIIEVRLENSEIGQRKDIPTKFSELISALPWNIIGDELKQIRAQLALQNLAVYDGLMQSNIEPIINATGNVNIELAQLLIQMRFNLEEVIPISKELKLVIDRFIELNKGTTPDIWESRTVRLPVDLNLPNVVVGVWDSGIDTQIFGRQMATSSGKHSIAWDLQAQPSSASLYPLSSEELLSYKELTEHLSGFIDLQMGLASPRAEAVQSRMMMLAAEDVWPFLERLTLISDYIHGTHVAGVAIAENPFARLLSARVTWNYRFSVPALLKREFVNAQVAAYTETVAFFKKGSARVVNISWNRSSSLYDENHSDGAQLSELDRQGLYDAINNAPEILFVVAAGNGGVNVDTAMLFPSSFNLQNILVVGAADRSGNDAVFTNYGNSVSIYANGCEILGYVPGGSKTTLSGTSMAAAQVTNLAAMLFALRPDLKPVEVINLILSCADRRPVDHRRLINPRRTVIQVSSNGHKL